MFNSNQHQKNYEKLHCAICELKIHDHICSIYETREEQFSAVIPYIQEGLKRNEKCVYIADENSIDEIVDLLKDSIPEIEEQMRKNSLVIISKEESYLRLGYFDPDWMMNFLIDQVKTAKSEGYTALRVTGEASWALGDNLMTRQLIEYESKVNSVLQKIEVSALCQYNKKHFTPDIIKNVIETHPTVIYKNHVCKNYHYIPTEEFLSERDKYDEATRMLNQILLIENYVESLESREKELIAAKTRAEEATRLKSEFLAQMSHEIRSPINTMLNYISLIKEMAQEIENPDLDYSFEAIDSSSRRLIRTIDLILNVSQLQTGRYECNFREIDLELDVIIPLVREMQSSAKAKGLKLKYEGEAEESKVIADEYTVTQIFQNLIDNAIKYTKEGEVRVTTRVNEKVVEVIISDTGIGMSEEFMDKLFDPFTQEEQGYTRHYEGSGLGLALVSGYCRLNNASIKVESEKGKGTNFTVCFSKDRKYTYF